MVIDGGMVKGPAGTCRCGCGLVQQRAWARADTDQRRYMLAQGLRVLQGRGMCRGCYLRAWKAGEIPHRATPVKAPGATPTVCPRCGIESPGLCRDCEDVLERDELALWNS